MRVYVVDNGGQWTHREMRVLKYIGVDVKIVPNTTKFEELVNDGVGGLVLSGGSPRIGWESSRLGEIGDYLDRASFPIMGICVGHQFMALHYGGKVGPAEMPEYGQTEISVVKKCELLDGIPGTFTAWESHNDEVSQLPEGFECCASSENCKVQIMRSTKKPYFGVQYHPEVEHTEYGTELFKNFVKLCKR